MRAHLPSAPASVAQIAATRLFHTTVMSITWSTDACIIPTTATAMITAHWRWQRKIHLWQEKEFEECSFLEFFFLPVFPYPSVMAQRHACAQDKKLSFV
jgi:hypothetical protein